MNEKMQKALNDQFNAEYQSGYLYLSAALYCADAGFDGFANWFNIQTKEETDHAMIFANYILSRGGKAELSAIPQIKTSWDSLLDIMEYTLAHEQKVTSLINDLYALATDNKDYATVQMLNWFIDEQVEEEETVRQIIDKLKLVGDSGQGIYMLDQEMAARTYTQTAQLATKLLK